MSEALLSVDGLSIDFQVEGERRPVLRDVSFEVGRNETFGLVGESGSGKSTVLLAAMNYLAANARIAGGRVLFQEQDMLKASRGDLDRIRGRRVAMVYQDPGTAFNPSMTVGDQISEAGARHLGLDRSTARDRALAYLEKVRLEDPSRVLGVYPHQLSGGQKQRAMIAMALCCEPDLLLMDEPTTALDVVVQAYILDLVRELCRDSNTGIVFVTHDLGAVAQVADRVAVLYAGELMEVGSAREVLRERRNPYTRGLIAALPNLRGRTFPRAIHGMISRDTDRFDRCVFAGRCPWTAQVCRTSRPELVRVTGTWRSRCHFAAEPEKLTGRGRHAEEPDIPAEPSAATETRPLLTLRDLQVTYRRSSGLFDLAGLGRPSAVRAVKGLSLELHAERTVGIVGESGSGKTTVARAVLGLLPAASGEILFQGDRIGELTGAGLRAYRRKVQIVFQNPTSSLNPRKTVLQLVARPLVMTVSSWRAARETAARILSEVGLDESYAGRLPPELSGGEKQRVAIARAFATEPRLLILDEPTTALDVSVQATVLRLLARLKVEHRCAYLLISHDLAVVRQLADDVVVMRHGEVCEAGPAERLFERPEHPYTKALIEAVPTVGG